MHRQKFNNLHSRLQIDNTSELLKYTDHKDQRHFSLSILSGSCQVMVKFNGWGEVGQGLDFGWFGNGLEVVGKLAMGGGGVGQAVVGVAADDGM